MNLDFIQNEKTETVDGVLKRRCECRRTSEGSCRVWARCACRRKLDLIDLEEPKKKPFFQTVGYEKRLKTHMKQIL